MSYSFYETRVDKKSSIVMIIHVEIKDYPTYLLRRCMSSPFLMDLNNNQIRKDEFDFRWFMDVISEIGSLGISKWDQNN